MNFDEAIAAHTAWKSKLQDYGKKPDHSLKAAEVEADNKCPLGQWIHGEGKRWSSSPRYSNLKLEHTKFHQAAAAVVRKADSGQSVTEETALGAKSDFAIASSAVVSAVMHVKQEVH